jgi:uncharacterized protein
MSTSRLYVDFAKNDLDSRLKWYCPPASAIIDRDRGLLRVRTNASTDYWQRTHYGFEVDNGHFLYLEAEGDFVLTTKVTSHPVNQYDQAGLMVRISEKCWIKTSVEYEPKGANRLGAVVTNQQYSDWSTQPISREVATVWFRIQTEGSDVIVNASFNGIQWEQLRMARLHDRETVECVKCGLYACSPKGSGYEAEFEYLSFEPGRLIS